MVAQNHYPDFLGIGAQKSATSWLSALLASNPDVYMPRKEMHFFDRHYDLGWDWYGEQFAAKPTEARVTGDFTPKYMYDPAAADRIVRHMSDVKLICILRDPVARAFSHYKMAVQKYGVTTSFEEYTQELPEALERGLYHHQLKRFEKYLADDRLLVLICETVVDNPILATEKLATFLNIDATQFTVPSVNDPKAGRSKTPRFSKARKAISSFGKFLHNKHMHRTSEVLIEYAMPLARVFFEKETPSQDKRGSAHLFSQYAGYFSQDIIDLEKLLSIDLSGWRSHPANEALLSENTKTAQVS